jgi:hypothetical protein
MADTGNQALLLEGYNVKGEGRNRRGYKPQKGHQAG